MEENSVAISLRETSQKEANVPKSRMFNTDEDVTCQYPILTRIIVVLAILFSVILFPFTIFIAVKIAQQYQRAVIFRLGKMKSQKPEGPGIFFIIPFIESIELVDIRTTTLDIPKQQVLTKDSVTIEVDAVLYSHIFDPVASVVNVKNVFKSAELIGATSLRNIIATKSLSEFLGDQENITKRLKVCLDEVTDEWGLKIERVEITDVRLPAQMQRAMAAEAEALRESRAKVLSAEGEEKASYALKNAADIISSSPTALQLRYLQTLSAASMENNSTILFPIPIELFKHFAQ